MPDNKPPSPKPGETSAFSVLTGRLFWLVTTALVIAVLGSIYVIFYRTWEDVVTGQHPKSTLQAEQQLADAKARLDVLKSHAAEFASFPEADRARMMKALPADPAIPELLVLAEALTTEAGGAQVEIRLGATQIPGEQNRGRRGSVAVAETAWAKSHIPSTSLEISMKVANYEHAKAVVESLTSSLRLIDIQKVSFVPTSGDLMISALAYSE